MFFKLIKVHLSVSELYIYQTARCNDEKNVLSKFIFLKCLSSQGELAALEFISEVINYKQRRWLIYRLL